MSTARPIFTTRLLQRRWAHLLEEWAPERCTLATAASILGVDPTRLGRVISSGLGGHDLTPTAVLSRRELVEALRRSAWPPRR
jgi:hypothetical protein